MADTKQPQIIIVGAGLAGLALALLLKQHDITCTILELRERGAFSGGYLALAPNACRVLKRIGAYDRISKQGYNYEDLEWLSARNMSRIGTIWHGNQHRYGFKACRVGRGIVRGTLLEMAEEQGIEIRHGVKVTAIQEDTNRSKVILTLSDGNSAEADFAIGADGIHSQLRKYIDPECTPRFSGQMGLGGPVAASRLEKLSRGLHMPCFILGKGNSFALMPCTNNGDKIGVSATIEANDRSRSDWERLMADKQHLANILEDRHDDSTEWPDLVKTACREVDVDSLSLWPFYKVPVLQNWTSASGRVILIGDSAHGLPPTGGQGSSMAFEDAATLADVLSVALRDEWGLKERTNKWQTHRKARIEKVMAFTSKGGDARKASSSYFQQVFKEWAMWAYFKWVGKEMGMGWCYDYDTQKVTL